MDIRIKKIKITNFKGIRSFEACFDGDVTEFRGDNATGKTTLMDAFTWCLYGKDSYGRSDSNFRLKTLDADNRVIYHLPHEVEVTLFVDCDDVVLRRSYTENWRKRRGHRSEELAGHIVERYWNNVPMTEKEYCAKIDEICSEDVFQMVTNPTHFLSLPKKDQRVFLLNMAGDVDYMDIAAEREEFRGLAAEMSGKTIEEFGKEIGAKIKRIKGELESIPSRIDERQRSNPEPRDWSEIERRASDTEARIKGIDAKIGDAQSAYDGQNGEKQAMYAELSKIDADIAKRSNELQSAVMDGYYRDKSEYERLLRECEDVKRSKSQSESRLSQLGNDIRRFDERRDELIAEWKEIKSRKFVVKDYSEFVCPTCKRPLERGDIDAKVAEMEHNFYEEVTMLLERNKQSGVRNNDDKSNALSAIDALKKDIAGYEKSLADIVSKLEHGNPVKPSADTGADAKIVSLRAKRDELQARIDATKVSLPNLDSLKWERESLLAELQTLRDLLKDRDTISANNKRIMELSEQQRAMNNEIAELEGMQFKIAELKHALVDKVEEKINSLFSIVKFKMYEELLNGGEAETCEALVNGVPYSTNLNTAARINAGIDIINAISKHYCAYAPIWVDNRESITELIPTESQVINLVKDENYKTLTRITND